jgi:uncharacterized coiled-coil protein SlyX
MNAELMHLWGSWMNNALAGRSQLDMLSQWWLQGMESMTSLNRQYLQPWNFQGAGQRSTEFSDGWQIAWEPLLMMQRLSMQWMGMVPKKKYDALSERVEELEYQVQEQAGTIDRLRGVISKSGAKNDAVVAQFQDLIGQQSKQFKQLTDSFQSYIINGGSKKATSKK